MINPVKMLTASILSLSLLAGCDDGLPGVSEQPTRISEPIYQAIYNIGVARIIGDECPNIRWSRIASDRYVNDVIDELVRKGVNPMEARRALREVSDVRLQADFNKFLAENNAENLAAFCALGRSEISNRTIIGRMMAGG